MQAVKESFADSIRSKTCTRNAKIAIPGHCIQKREIDCTYLERERKIFEEISECQTAKQAKSHIICGAAPFDVIKHLFMYSIYIFSLLTLFGLASRFWFIRSMFIYSHIFSYAIFAILERVQ